MELKWEWEATQNIIKWKFVEISDNKKNVIGTVITTQIWNNHWDVEAICTEIGYNRLLENVNQQNIRNVVLDNKKFIQEGVERERLMKKIELKIEKK